MINYVVKYHLGPMCPDIFVCYTHEFVITVIIITEFENVIKHNLFISKLSYFGEAYLMQRYIF